MTPAYPLRKQSDDDPAETDHAVAAVRAMLDLYTYIAERKSQHNLFDTKVMRDLSRGLLHASAHPKHPSVLYELLVDEHYTNLNGVLHGAAASLIFDMATMSAMCPIQREGVWDFQVGTSRTLNLSFLRAVPLGTTVRVKCWVMQHGRTTCMLSGVITSVDGETVYATCEHHKIHIPISKEHATLREEMKREMKKREEDLLERATGDKREHDDDTQKAKL